MDKINMDEIKSLDIQSLLQEMCILLKTVCKQFELPKHLQSKAEMLIQKSDSLTNSTKVRSEYYIDMNARNGTFNNDLPTLEDTYSETSYMNSVSPSEYETPCVVIEEGYQAIINDDNECPYLNKSYADLKEEKLPLMAGILRRGRKFFGIFCSRKYFVIVKENWLLLYLSEKDDSPTHYCNLSNHKIITDAINDKSFELKDNDNKTYTFVAENPKEKEQWIAQINENIYKKTKDRTGRSRQLPSIPTATINMSRKLCPKYAPSKIQNSYTTEIYTEVDNVIETNQSDQDEGNYAEAETAKNCIEASTYETIGVVSSPPQYQNSMRYFRR